MANVVGSQLVQMFRGLRTGWRRVMTATFLGLRLIIRPGGGADNLQPLACDTCRARAGL